MRRAPWLILVLFPLLARAGSVEAPIKPVLHEVRLRSGSLLVGTLEPAQWKVQTAFGALMVPVNEVQQVRFGRLSDPDRVAQVKAWIAELASANPDRRDHGRASLKAEGAFAAGDLRQAAKHHTDPEVKRICRELLQELDLSKKDLVPEEDRIETRLFTISGNILASSFKVTVAELGAVDVRRKDVVSIRVHDARWIKIFKITAANNQLTTWVDTNFDLQKGEVFTVTATGGIHFPSWGNQTFSPDGNRNMGMVNNMPMGALVGRIGPQGATLLIGSNFRGQAKASGRLYLCMMIHPNIRNQQNSGLYTVQVRRGGDPR